MITVADKANLGFLEDALAALDEGRYAEGIVTFEVEGAPVSGPMGQLWRAEVALYLDRLDVAASLVETLGPVLDEFVADNGSFGVLARRKLLVEAEIAHFRGDLGAARELASKAARFALLADDVSSQIRAFIDLGRIARNRGEYSAALAHLATVSDLAKEHGTPFALGLVKYYEGTTLMHTGRIEEGRESLEAALGLLESVEKLRYAGMTAGVLGAVLCDLGSTDQGLALLERAEGIAADLAIPRDMLPVANNVARSLLALGRAEEAETRLRNLVAWERSEGDAGSEMQALKMLTVALTEQRKLKEAAATADELTRLASSQSAASDQLDGELLSARVRARSHSTGAVELLREMLAKVDVAGVDFQKLEARIYLAEALVGTSSVESRRLIDEVRDSAIFGTMSWLRVVFDRVASDLERVPVRVDADSLVIDTRLGFPSLREAREAVERFLFDRSMSETNGNASAAGRLIGASPFQMHCLGRALQGLPTRPGRNPDPDAPPARRRPRKLHWKE